MAIRARTSSTDFAVHIRAVGKSLGDAQRVALQNASMTVKNSIEHQARIAMKGSLEFSNMRAVRTRTRTVKANGRNNALRVGFDIKGEKNLTALLVARGPWGLIEYGSQKHFVTPKLESIQRKGISTARYKRLTTQRRLDIAFGAVHIFSGVPPLAAAAGQGKPVYRVTHPGTRGKRPFHKGLELARPVATRQVRSVITRTVAQTFKMPRNVSGPRTVTYAKGDITGFRI